MTLKHEVKLAPELKSWLAFADEKLEELRIIATALNAGEAAVAAELAVSRAAIASRAASPLVNNAAVKARIAALNSVNENRENPFILRQVKQQARLKLPALPTTTIGSFPQTADIRASRAAF